jgi:hypothetical protein
MKKVLFFFFTMQLSFVYAQKEFAPIGAKWHYNEPGFNITGKPDYVLFESIKDTLIKGRKCRKLSIKLNNARLIGNEYIFQSKDSIFYYNKNSNLFSLLYNFSAKVGDTISFSKTKFKAPTSFYSTTDSILNFQYKILFIDSIKISNAWLKRQKVVAIHNGEWGFPGGMLKEYFILEKTGSLNYFFGVSPYVTPESTSTLLRCYNETGLSYKDPNWSNSCDFTTGLIEYLNEDVTCNIFPNPFNTHVSITSKDIIESIEICTQNGEAIISEFPKKETFDIDLNSNTGIYIIKVKTAFKTYTKQILKH